MKHTCTIYKVVPTPLFLSFKSCKAAWFWMQRSTPMHTYYILYIYSACRCRYLFSYLSLYLCKRYLSQHEFLKAKSKKFAWGHNLSFFVLGPSGECLSCSVGKKAYNEEKWAEAAEQFESSLLLYQEELSTCRLLCEDVLSINLTQPDMNEQKRKLFEEHSLVPDAMEYYDLLALIVQEVKFYHPPYQCHHCN